MQTTIKVLGIIALIWIGFMVLGAVFKFLILAVAIGAGVFLGSAAYAAVKSRSNRNALER